MSQPDAPLNPHATSTNWFSNILGGAAGGGTTSASATPEVGTVEQVRRNLRGVGERVGLVEREESSVFGERCCPDLTVRQRIMGWTACFVIGSLVSV